MKRPVEEGGFEDRNSLHKTMRPDDDPNNVFIKNIQKLKKERDDIEKHLKEIAKKVNTMEEACRIANITENGANPFKKTIQALENERKSKEELLQTVDGKLATLREAINIVNEVKEFDELDTSTQENETLSEGEDQDHSNGDYIDQLEEHIEVENDSLADEINAEVSEDEESVDIERPVQDRIPAASTSIDHNTISSPSVNSTSRQMPTQIIIKEEKVDDENSSTGFELENTSNFTDAPNLLGHSTRDTIFPFSNVAVGEFKASAQTLYQRMQKEVENNDIATFLNDMRDYTINLWQQNCTQGSDVMIKVQFWRNRITTVQGGHGSMYQALSVSSKYEAMVPNSSKQTLGILFDRMSQQLLKNYVEYCFSYPGGQFVCVLGLDVTIRARVNLQRSILPRGSNSNSPVKLSKYLQNQEIRLPKWVEYKRAVVNIRKWDYQSFKWAILVALHHQDVRKNLQRIELYKQYENELNFNNIVFPINKQEQIKKFEEQNPGLMIHVLEVDDMEKKIDVFWVSEFQTDRQRKPIVLLLYHIDSVWHFGWVKNFSRLMNYQRNGKREKGFPCLFCLKFHVDTSDKSCCLNK